MDRHQTEAALKRFWRAHKQGDPDLLAAELADDLVAEWPQSGERIRGKANMDAINRAMPGGHPKGSLLGLRAFDDFGILEMRLDYGSETAFVVELLEYRDGKIAGAVEYFAEPFSAPEWRQQWVEQIGR